MMRLSPSFKRILGQDGVAAIEFAIIAPLLVALVVGTVELGFAIRASLLAQEAASAGALYASQHGFESAGITAAVLGAGEAPGLTASPAPRLFCGCPEAGGVSARTCGTTCPDGVVARQYVEVSAALPRPTIVGSTLGLPASMTAASTVRLP